MDGILAQVSPPATTDTLLYRSPTAGNGTSVTTIFVCNQTGIPVLYRIRGAKKESAAVETQQYWYYDTSLDANATLKIDVGVNLSPGQAIFVRAATTGVSFNLCGIER